MGGRDSQCAVTNTDGNRTQVFFFSRLCPKQCKGCTKHPPYSLDMKNEYATNVVPVFDYLRKENAEMEVGPMGLRKG